MERTRRMASNLEYNNDYDDEYNNDYDDEYNNDYDEDFLDPGSDLTGNEPDDVGRLQQCNCNRLRCSILNQSI